MRDDELDRFKRDINLVEYAKAYGYSRSARSCRTSARLKNSANNDTIIVARAPSGHWIYFSVCDERDKGTIVDFVRNRDNRSLGEVRQHLRDYLGLPQKLSPLQERAMDLRPVARDRQGVLRAWAAAMDVPNSIYLNERGLRQETLAHTKFAGTWKQDARGNVLFAHRDEEGVSGYEIKNHGFTGFATGGTKRLWHSRPTPDDRVLVVAESAIDALSYHQLGRQPIEATRYASLGGTASPVQLEFVGTMLAQMPSASTLVAAVDADDGGLLVAKQLKSIVDRRLGVAFRVDSPDRSIGKDWNDVLQRFERDFIRSLPLSSPRFDRGIAR